MRPRRPGQGAVPGVGDAVASGVAVNGAAVVGSGVVVAGTTEPAGVGLAESGGVGLGVLVDAGWVGVGEAVPVGIRGVGVAVGEPLGVAVGEPVGVGVTVPVGVGVTVPVKSASVTPLNWMPPDSDRPFHQSDRPTGIDSSARTASENATAARPLQPGRRRMLRRIRSIIRSPLGVASLPN